MERSGVPGRVRTVGDRHPAIAAALSHPGRTAVPCTATPDPSPDRGTVCPDRRCGALTPLHPFALDLDDHDGVPRAGGSIPRCAGAIRSLSTRVRVWSRGAGAAGG